jgi:(S)-2-hydroxyglutarate dehydrogenase
MSRIVVVGGGIVGLATARRLLHHGHEVTLLEKEPALARHQSGRNSGVVHAGLYYPPGSHKAEMAVRGNASMRRYAEERGIGYRLTGKLVVATDAAEIPGLRRLAERAEGNGVPARLVGPEEAREHEPYVSCVAALWVKSTGIIDFPAVCRSLGAEIEAAGGELRLRTELLAVHDEPGGLRVETSGDEIRADALVGCAGLYADRVAELAGLEPEARILPFRGEYFELAPRLDHLVRGLVYPVPDPRFPFLGVHLTRSIHGGIHVGPNAVLALRREGYTWRDIDVRELGQSLRWPGWWRLAARHWRPGAAEVGRSLSKRAFARSVSRLVPGVTAGDLRPAPAGVRAQAVRRDGGLVDDFLMVTAPRQLHVLNAPSPAATASLEIADHLAGLLPDVLP